MAISTKEPSRLNQRTIKPTHGCPVGDTWVVPQGVLFGDVFLDVNAQASLPITIQVTTLDCTCAGHHLMDYFWKMVFLLNPEAGNAHVHMISRQLVDGIVVATLLKRGTHTAGLAEHRKLLGGCDST